MNCRWVFLLAIATIGICSAQDAPTHPNESLRLVVQTGHSNNVASVAFSPDGKTLISGSADGTLKLWDAATGRELRTLRGHEDGVHSIAFSPDGKQVISGSGDQTLKVWDLASGQELRTFHGHSHEIMSVAFSPDSQTVVSGSRDNTLILWNVATGQKVRTLVGHSEGIRSIAFSPDGKTIASGSEDDTLKLWDSASGRELHTVGGFTRGVFSVAFSPDSKVVASGSYGKTLKLVDVATGRVLRTLEQPSAVSALAFSHDGKKLAVGSLNSTIKLLNMDSERELHTFNFSGHVLSLAFAPDGKTLVSGSYDGLKLWDVVSGRKLRTLGDEINQVNTVAFSPDRKTVMFGSDDGIKLWDLASGREPRILLGEDARNVISAAFTPDGKTLTTVSLDGLRQWDVGQGQLLQSYHTYGAIDKVKCIAFSPDGKIFVSGDWNGFVTLWNMTLNSVIEMDLEHSKAVKSVAFSPDGKIVASGSADNTIILWNVANGRVLLKLRGHRRGVNTIAFSPDGKTLASGSFDGLKLWDVASGRELRTLREDSDSVLTVTFSPDGKTIISGTMDNTLKIWDVASARVLHILRGHSYWVNTVALSADGQLAVSASHDKTVKLWRTVDGVLLATLASFKDGRWAVIDPEGRFDVADLEDMPHLHWVMPDDPFTPLPIEIFMRNYYEPRLLSRILSGEKFKSVSDLSELNRVQPKIRITSVTPVSGQAKLVDVSIEASGISRRYGLSNKIIATAVHDLRLFRNGQLVGHADGQLAAAGLAPYRKTWRVHLPEGERKFTFSAYAFNDDRVKSATVYQDYTPTKTIVTTKPTAWIINMGVNHHENAAWDLNYAVNDAHRINVSLSLHLRAQNKYKHIVSIQLISDKKTKLATKANLKAVLDRLAGKTTKLGAIPNSEKLKKASPNDLVLISFSGHGVNDDGSFYLIPSDTGNEPSRILNDRLKSRAISSEELTNWLRDVDGGDIALIIDACQSAASVGNEFKPGPMGARGLGQLAYEKGMRILVASQAEEYALESSLTQQGLLSYALVNDGLDRGKADFLPKDRRITLAEWLSFGVQRVPNLSEEVARGQVDNRGQGKTGKQRQRSLVEEQREDFLQHPALFDFTKGRHDSILVSESTELK